MSENIGITRPSDQGRVSSDLSGKHVAIIGCVGSGKTTLLHLLMSQFKLEEENIHIVTSTDEIKELPEDTIILHTLHDEITLPRIEDLLIKRDSLESLLPLSSHRLSNFKYTENFLYGNGYHKEWRR